MLVVAAGLGVVSYSSSEGTDLRPGRYQDLSQLVSGENDRVEAQIDQVARMRAEVEDLTADISDGEVRAARTDAATVGVTAGFSEVTGPGLSITLSDAPPEQAEASTRYALSDFVVHQQDIQAIVNALWAGGARAVTVQGQRIISTTSIKCEGTMVTLDGLPFPQPYVISGVGDLTGMLAAIDADRRTSDYRAAAANPAIGVGWDLTAQPEMTAAAYENPVTLAFAKVDR